MYILKAWLKSQRLLPGVGYKTRYLFRICLIIWMNKDLSSVWEAACQLAAFFHVTLHCFAPSFFSALAYVSELKLHVKLSSALRIFVLRWSIVVKTSLLSNLPKLGLNLTDHGCASETNFGSTFLSVFCRASLSLHPWSPFCYLRSWKELKKARLKRLR